jgi:hypothetical protein
MAGPLWLFERGVRVAIVGMARPSPVALSPQRRGHGILVKAHSLANPQARNAALPGLFLQEPLGKAQPRRQNV